MKKENQDCKSGPNRFGSVQFCGFNRFLGLYFQALWISQKTKAPQVFTRENILHLVTQFVAVDDQVNTHQGSNYWIFYDLP